MIHWTAIVELSIAVVLSVVIGIEREYQEKAAGVRTCALVGLGAALFTVVSRNGAWLLPGLTVTNVDGSRVAAQIVSGIGFLGAGLIFVRRDSVQGLTTAASVWMVAAVGMAAGAGVPDLAVAATLIYMVVVVGILPLRRRIPHTPNRRDTFWITYEDGRGALRDIMRAIGDHGVSVEGLNVVGSQDVDGVRLQRVQLDLHAATSSLNDLLRTLADVPGVQGLVSDRSSRHQD